MESNLKAAGIDLQDRRPLSRTGPGVCLAWPRLMFTSHKPHSETTRVVTSYDTHIGSLSTGWGSSLQS